MLDPFLHAGASIDWIAPELLASTSTTYQASVPSDIYAIAMTIYEVSPRSLIRTKSDSGQVLVGERPFAGRAGTELACEIVLGRKWPQKPITPEKLGFTGEVCELLQRCWEKEPSARPSIEDVSTCLERAAETWVVDVPAFMLASKAGVDQVMDFKEDQAKDFANKLDEVRRSEVEPNTLTRL